MLAVGGEDGRIRLLDPRLRSASVEHVLKAHTGPVQAVAVTPTDGVKVPTEFIPARSFRRFATDARSPAHPPPLKLQHLRASPRRAAGRSEDPSRLA